MSKLSKLKVEGRWVYDQEQIQNFVERFYVDLYIDRIPRRLTLLGVEFDRISRDMSKWLESPFSEEEVLCALNSMEEDKALGPDGFPIKILKVCWEVVGEEVMAVFAKFYTKDSWCKSLSATFLTLIPKKNGLLSLKTTGLSIWWDVCINRLLKRWPIGSRPFG